MPFTSKKVRPQPKSGPYAFLSHFVDSILVDLSQTQDDLHEHIHEERCCHKKAKTHNDAENEVYEHALKDYLHEHALKDYLRY